MLVHENCAVKSCCTNLGKKHSSGLKFMGETMLLVSYSYFRITLLNDFTTVSSVQYFFF